MNYANSKYFNSLPQALQEGILQSGINFENENDLVDFVANKEIPLPHTSQFNQFDGMNRIWPFQF